MKLAKEFAATGGQRIRAVLWTVLICAIVAGTSVMFSFGGRLRSVVTNQIRTSMSQTCQENAKSVQREISSRMRSLEAQAIRLGTMYFEAEIPAMVESLEGISDMYGYYSMGIFAENGQGCTTRGATYNIADRAYFQQAMNGELAVTESMLGSSGELALNFFAAPVQRSGRVQAVLVAAYDSLRFRELMNTGFLENTGKSVILDSQGKVVSYHAQEDGLAVDDLAEYISRNADIAPQEENTFFTFTYESVEYIAFIVPIAVNDWYVLSYIPSSYVTEEVEELGRSIMLTLGLLYLCVLGLAMLCGLIYHRLARRVVDAAFRDDLTSARNYEYLKICYRNMSADERSRKYLVLFDVDKFKFVNILYGSEVGDQILQSIVDVFQQTLPREQLFRSTADIFVAVLSGESPEAVEEKIRYLDEKLREKANDGQRPPFILSYGVCRMDKGENLRLVYDNAMMARSVAKRSTHDKCRFFAHVEERQIAERELEASFAEALTAGEFQAWYQPQYDLYTRDICGAEALVRWQRPDGTLIFPGEFIPALEADGRIVEMDEAVLRQVCWDMANMQRQGLPIVPVSVNLSKTHLQRPGAVARLAKIVEEAHVDASWISFEITESAMLGTRNQSNDLMAELHQRGFHVGIDDYGVGSSSLQSLAGANFDVLKLDRAFIDQIGEEKVDIILRSTIEMARKLGMRLVAEGVETERQARFLWANRCHIAQGYLFSRPVDREAYIQLLRSVPE